MCACVRARVFTRALQDLKIALANTPRVHPLFVLYCIVYYKSVFTHGAPVEYREGRWMDSATGMLGVSLNWGVTDKTGC